MLGQYEIEKRYGVHVAADEGRNATGHKHEEVRKLFIEIALKLDETLPEGRAKSIASDELENASMWAHKAIAESTPLVSDL